MKAKEQKGQLREKNELELRELGQSLRRQLFDTRMKNYTNQLDNTAQLRNLRRDIARVNTLLAQRKASASSARQVK